MLGGPGTRHVAARRRPRPLFSSLLLIIGAAVAPPHRVAGQCADDDAGLVDAFLRQGNDIPQITCAHLAAQAMCDVLDTVPDAVVFGGNGMSFLQYCGTSCVGSCVLSTAQCTVLAEAAETTKDILDLLDACPRDGMCTVAADAALRLPVCAAAAGVAPSTDGCTTLPAVCPLACAEVILPVAARCAGDAAALFVAALPAGLVEACGAAVTFVLAGAPASITVDITGQPRFNHYHYHEDGHERAPSACHTVRTEDRGFEGRYMLQPVTLNGQPHYAQAGSGGRMCASAEFRNHQCGRHLYWSPSRADSHYALWLLDWTTDSSAPMNAAHFYLASPGDILPLGPAKWIENWLNYDETSAGYGDHETNACRLQLTQSPPVGGCDAGLVALAPVLTAFCCGPEASSGCGVAGELPDTCSADCRGVWAPFAARCPALVDAMASTPAGEFFNVACMSRVLEPLPPTAGATVGRYFGNRTSSSVMSYPFTAAAGTRYVYQIRLGLSTPWIQSMNVAMDRLYECGFARGIVCTSEEWYSYLEGKTVAATDGNFGAPDKGYAWTAPATGTYYIEALWFDQQEADDIRETSLSVEAVGTAVGRAADADTTGALVPFGVACEFFVCGFTHNGSPVLGASNAGYELLLQARQGVAYAMAVALVGTVAAEIHLKAYYPGSVAGAGGYDEVLGGPLGDWIATPAGHYAYAYDDEAHGVSQHEMFVMQAAGGASGAPPLFGFHPGESFERRKRATWAAPASGAALLQVVASCDVRFFADTAAPGCRGFGTCTPYFEGSTATNALEADGAALIDAHNGNCNADMTLAITAGAHFDVTAAESSSQLAAEMFVPTPGAAVRVATIEMGRPELEQFAREMFVPTTTLTVPPTLEQMLVPGSEASELLASMFSAEQQPHLSFPTAITPLAGGTSSFPAAEGGDGHRRQLQRADGAIDRVLITVKATAPTAEESEVAITGLQALAANGRRLQQTVAPVSNKTTRWLQTAEECGSGIDLSEECQRAAQCAVGMSAACIIGADCSLESTAPSAAAVAIETIEVSRSEAEQRAAEMFAVSPPPGMVEPPTLEQMLVPGSEASVMLASMFTTEQQPHLAFPTAIEPIPMANSGDDGGGGGGGHRHRRHLQRADGTVDRVRITLKAVAPTSQEAERSIAMLQTMAANGR